MVTFALTNTFLRFLQSLTPDTTIVEYESGYGISHRFGVSTRITLHEGEYQVGTIERSSDPDYTLFTPNLDLAEKYLVSLIGARHRFRHNLSPFDSINMRRNRKTGYDYRQIDADYSSLISPDGEIVPAKITTSVSLGDLNAFSYIVNESIEDVISSYLDRYGRPLFNEFLARDSHYY